MNIDFSAINWIAVGVCSLAGFLLGGIWYGAIFTNGWIDAYGFTEAELEASKKVTGRNFAAFLIVGLVLAAALAMIFQRAHVVAWDAGLKMGAFIGFVLVGGVILMQVMAGNYKLKAFTIDACYYGTWFAAMGAILGGWK